MEVVEEVVEVEEEAVEEEAVEVEAVEEEDHQLPNHHNSHNNSKMWRQQQMLKQWESSRIRSMVTEQKQRISSKKLRDIFT